MKLLIYLPALSEKRSRLAAGIRRLPAEINVEMFDTLAGFIGRIRQPKDDFLISILFDPSHDDLEDVRGVRQFLANVPLLLVLSDQDMQTIALAHRLLPSYVTYVDSDLAQLFSVIRKLSTAGQESRKSGGEKDR
jgi:hypothetical protein